ncbi:MAG: hypothetical protein G01um101424_179 [Parcubacteria group bacterium Gr01-1014_24]|nr:MAG: hypothetical protein G01um101424_179 [Parcubacteria group bacterium Gr01-1014_24]
MKINKKTVALLIIAAGAATAFWILYSSRDEYPLVLSNTPSRGPVVEARTNPKLGRYQTHLTDPYGRTLYISLDRCPDSTLRSDCLDDWIPYLVNPDIPLDKTDPILSQVSTVWLPNNIHQYTYLGWPLFYYRNDRNTGDVKGHNITNGNWVAVLLHAEAK